MDKEIAVPAWIFDRIGDYFMVGIEPDGRVRIDGGHRGPDGVAKAVAMHKSIKAIQSPDGTRFIMVRIQEVPDRKVRLNQKAIDQLNDLPGHRGAIK